MTKKVVIVAAKRTAIGSFCGSLASFSAPELGSIVIDALIKETNIDKEKIDQVILGNVLTAGLGQNPARQAAVKSGLSYSTPASVVNVVCGSGLRAVHLAAQAILSGESEIVIAGGQESMSQAPYLLPNLRMGNRMGDVQAVDSMLNDGLIDAYHHYHMIMTAENLAEKYHISRETQDQLSLNSQQKAAAARKAGKFNEEIVSIAIPQRKGDPVIFDQDEFIKENIDLEKLIKLKPALKKDGTITAGNASGINDGAAAVLVMSEDKAKEFNLDILGYIESYALSGCAPEIMGIGPVEAVKKVLNKANWTLEDVDLIEANEAFAAQALAVAEELKFDMLKVNVNGGAIALGHPIGASGCRILVSLLHEMKRRNVKKGIATLCIGGGMGIAVAISRGY